MQYYVTQTIQTRRINAYTGKPFICKSATHIPCFTLNDAEHMCEALSKGPGEYENPHSKGEKMLRGYEVSARVYINKGSIVLSMAEIEGIAQQYNHAV